MTAIEAIVQSTEFDWQKRVQFFLVKAAVAIHNESPATAEHDARVALAELVLADQTEWSARFSAAITTNPTILAAASLSAVPDNDIEFVTNSMYNSFTQVAAATLVSPKPVVVSALLTRPSNTATYTVGDELTDVGGAIREFVGCARVAAGAGVLDSITIIDSANPTLDAALDVFLFDTTSTPQADNTLFAPSDAVMNTAVGALSMGTPISGDAAAGGNLVYQQRNLGLPFVCLAGSTSLFARFVIRNAYVPVSGETFLVRLGIRQF